MRRYGALAEHHFMNKLSATPASPNTTWPVLYSFRRCPYAMRARLALAASGQTVELREIDLKNKHPLFLQTSPKGTVPVLVLKPGDENPTVIDQSIDIMRWALERHDPMGWLQPTHATTETAYAWIAACDGPFKYALDRCKYPHRYRTQDTSPNASFDVSEHRQAASAWLQSLEQQLILHPYLVGHHASWVDMALAPFIRQFAHIDTQWWSEQPWPRLQQWLTQWQASPLFLQIMDKHPVWQADHPPRYWPHQTL